MACNMGFYQGCDTSFLGFKEREGGGSLNFVPQASHIPR